jgi:NAD(P)H dehydrogenase (quinone)
MLRNGLYAELLVAETEHAAATGTLTAPLGDGRLAAVARQDLADAAARVLVEADAGPHSRHTGQVYELVGETAVGGTDLAGVAAGVVGTPVAYRPGTLAWLRSMLADTGLPGWRVENVVSTYSVTAAGFLAGTDSALRDLLDTDPRPVLPLIAAAARGGSELSGSRSVTGRLA